ncbi:MAG: phosphatidate cytidylyltransferase [Clostridia bacterium]
MLKRTITGASIIALLLADVLWLRNYSIYFTDIAILVFAFFGAWEVFHSMKSGGYNMMELAFFATMVVLYPLVLLFNSLGIMLAVFVGTIIALLQFTFSKKGYSLNDATATIFATVYPMSFMSLFLLMNHGVGELVSIFLVLAISIFSDTFAYFVGVTVKGPKLCPTISPKKTISGAVGAVFGGMLGAVLIFLLFEYYNVLESWPNLQMTRLFTNWKIALPVYLAIGAVCSALTMVGDLSASSIKRKMGIKDFGKIFPGHGGFMDRLDGITFVAPAVYFAVALIMKING